MRICQATGVQMLSGRNSLSAVISFSFFLFLVDPADHPEKALISRLLTAVRILKIIVRPPISRIFTKYAFRIFTI